MKKNIEEGGEIVRYLDDLLRCGFTLVDISFLTGLPDNTLRTWRKTGHIWNRTDPTKLERLGTLHKKAGEGTKVFALPYPTQERGLARRRVLGALRDKLFAAGG
jgi:hypothetical protein